MTPELQPAPKPPAKPVSGLYDKRFQYVPACKTNIAETFRRVRAEMANGTAQFPFNLSKK